MARSPVLGVAVVLASSLLAPRARADDAVRYRPGPAGLGTASSAPAGLLASGASPCAPPCVPPALDPCDPRCDVGCDARRGPIEIRDMYLLAQPRLTLPAVSPDTLGCGRSSVRVQFHWSNSFGWRQDVTGETPGIRWYMVDGEARTVDVTAMHGVTDDVDVGVRLPVHWRGAGVLDSIIDAFHGTIPSLFLDNERKDFRNDVFRVNGLLEDGTPFSEDAAKGTGLGNVEAIGRWRCVDGGRDGLSLAVVGRVTAPTGGAPFDTEGVEAALQVAVAQRVAPRFDVFAGIGETWYQEPTFHGIRYAAWRTTVFGAVEWRFCAWGSLLLQIDYAGPLAADVANFAPDHLYAHLGAKLDVARDTVFEVGFTENIVDQQTTADFGGWFGLEHRW